MARTKTTERQRGQVDPIFYNDVADKSMAMMPAMQDESESEEELGYEQPDMDMDVDAGDKDAAEEELEKLVFGDSVGFREGLRNFAVKAAGDSDEEEDAEELEAGAGLEGLDDADLFFTDIGTSRVLPPVRDGEEDSEDEDGLSRRPAAWEDSDDERMVISLASVPRLRKLRRTEAEDVITGREYTKRLRKQFEILNPVPDWAVQATQKPAKKKRRLTENGDASSGEEMSEDDMDMDMDPEELSADPLSKLLQNANGLVRNQTDPNSKKRKLRPEVLDIQRLKDIPGVQPSAITSLSFHPTFPLLLSSGPSSTLYLHHIISSPPAEVANPLLTSLHIKNTPLTTTAFHPTDSRIFLSARRRYFHVWDLESGRIQKIARVYGHQHEQRSMERFKLSPDGTWMALLGSAKKGGGVVNILDAKTLQWSAQVRIESRGGVADFCWWSDSRGLCVAGKNGEVSEWNLLEQRVVARWWDEGAVGTSVLNLGGDSGQQGAIIGRDRWVAVGSSSGIVNIYDRRAWLVDAAKQAKNKAQGANNEPPVPTHPKPTRTLDQLTTPTSHLVFSPDGQMLVMASRWKKDALRIVHLPSCTVFKNWPTSNTPLGRITGVAFRGDSGMVAVANEAGKIRLWEIRA
ncbi:U3 snoRNP protein [Zalaria obscura]|uniref:U3 snoRNP protein n=1 Tax=Zalaria obscura TaxID=2024903 RepID=A0ACC3SBM9_9PEZI